MARPKKDPRLVRNERITVYLTTEHYEQFKEIAADNGMSLSDFLTYRPDLTKNSLEYLKRIHDLTQEIHVTYATVTGKHPQTHPSPEMGLHAAEYVSSEASDRGWEEYQRQKAAGSTLPDGDIHPQVALLAELRETFAKMKPK